MIIQKQNHHKALYLKAKTMIFYLFNYKTREYSTLLSCSNFPIFDYDKTIEIIIKNRNSNVLIGNTKENKQKLKEMIK